MASALARMTPTRDDQVLKPGACEHVRSHPEIAGVRAARVHSKTTLQASNPVTPHVSKAAQGVCFAQS